MSVIDTIRAMALCEANQEIERLKAIIAEREWRPPSKGRRTVGDWDKGSCPNLVGGNYLPPLSPPELPTPPETGE